MRDSAARHKEGAAWCEAAQAVAKRMDVRVEALRIGADLQDPERRWHAAHGVKADGAILVRPDGIVGWRAKGRGPSPEETLAKVLAQLLARPEAGVMRANAQ